MDCREFRDNHALLIDLRCSAIEENAMREHMRECPRCARHDAVVRRSLLLVKNLPTIEPSPDFQARLEARLRTTTPLLHAEPRFRVPSFGAFVALAAAIGFVAVLAMRAMTSAPDVIRMAPVVASAPEIEPSPVATSAFVATVPTGMSVWPAIMMASQAPMHFVGAELASER